MSRVPMPQATKWIFTVPHGNITRNFTAQKILHYYEAAAAHPDGRP